MKNKPSKVQMTVRLESEVHRAATTRSNRTGVPVAVVVADAVKHTLLPDVNGDELTLERSTDRILRRIGKIDAAWREEHHTLRELVALFLRMYLNHTPTVPENERKAASLSGRSRFNRIVDLLERNLRDGISVLDQQEESIPVAGPQNDLDECQNEVAERV